MWVGMAGANSIGDSRSFWGEMSITGSRGAHPAWEAVPTLRIKYGSLLEDEEMVCLSLCARRPLRRRPNRVAKSSQANPNYSLDPHFYLLLLHALVISCCSAFRIRMMFDHTGVHQKNNIFCNVCSVICNSFQTTAHNHQVDRPRNRLWV